MPFNHEKGLNGNNKNGYNCGYILVCYITLFWNIIQIKQYIKIIIYKKSLISLIQWIYLIRQKGTCVFLN